MIYHLYSIDLQSSTYQSESLHFSCHYLIVKCTFYLDCLRPLILIIFMPSWRQLTQFHVEKPLRRCVRACVYVELAVFTKRWCTRFDYFWSPVCFQFVYLLWPIIVFCCILSISGSRPVKMVVQATVPNILF